jgi:hypothetical protein
MDDERNSRHREEAWRRFADSARRLGERVDKWLGEWESWLVDPQLLDPQMLAEVNAVLTPVRAASERLAFFASAKSEVRREKGAGRTMPDAAYLKVLSDSGLSDRNIADLLTRIGFNSTPGLKKAGVTPAAVKTARARHRNQKK